MSELRNLRKKAREVPKEKQNYTILEGNVRKVLTYKQYQKHLKETEGKEPEEELTDGTS